MMGKNETHTKTLERGDIYFFYRPRVEEDSPEGKEEIQRVYLVLSPAGKKRFRLLIIGRKELPNPAQAGGDRSWAFVDRVTDSPSSMTEELREQTYSTKTRGERHLPASRPAGEGVYRLMRHDDHTHLVYALELPETTGDVQKELDIAEEASYIVSVKNPQASAPRGAGLSEERRADFPQRLKDVFRNRRFSELDPPDFLDHRGAELLLIAAAVDVPKELDIELKTDEEDRFSADLFQDLKIDKKRHPVEPLFEGEWE